MSRVSRGLVHAVAWSLSTGAAVTLSWWGVHTVMAGTAYDRPRALPITAQTSTTQAVEPQASSTHRPPSPSATSPSPGRSTPAARRPGTGKPPASSPSSSPAYESGTVKSHTVTGGRTVFDVGTRSAELVSATPAAGWQMQVWTQPTWIRVTFTQDGKESSVFYTWNGHPPMVQFDER
ncbi:hypothetical protein [Streptomyces sp. NPDC002889]|uniref:hypothetical protein n=1 Tax=Streptomyces sp. NPDC002889 TaxID=3364669 RepID=UPI0036782846